MIRFLVTILLIGFITQMKGQVIKSEYEIIKIDSTESKFIIDIKNTSNKHFRILSDKNKSTIKKCKKIIKNKYYQFTLYFFETIFADGKEVSTIVDDRLVWKEGDKFKICTTDNLKGLCYNCNKNK